MVSETSSFLFLITRVSTCSCIEDVCMYEMIGCLNEAFQSKVLNHSCLFIYVSFKNVVSTSVYRTLVGGMITE
jgi:hypothetical protein